ncbi:MAG: pyruvate dehydrogenase (acetyl-transferring) E1 component subunit alpha [Bdellovibrionales bacterium GWA2_49_15]|nr:MAG: pyruvate dehydrogenase (acetyl-transferring) E1 component subunit alpha [Bdellovibrionales bacterium GWA2_49_15]HAZ12735.1 pyruvate dehydrogenase (acetyl-transferring) E1 component subunit alpha [Bdellovibrionales bacterium]
MDTSMQMKMLMDMRRVRKMEEVCAELYTKEKIRGFLHLYIGQEAVAAGVINLLNAKDNVIATYREHAHALLKGISSRAIMAELFGRIDGCSKGRGGSMHLYSVENRFFGGGAIVASGVPQSLGLAMASKRLKERRRTVCFFGEGAMAEGVFHESMNIASLWHLPVLFCCENNLYAMGTSLMRSQSQTDLVKRAQVYVMEANRVDGMNIFDVVEKTKQALEYIDRESKPFFLEFQTYRFRPHSMYDPEKYRGKAEVEKWKTRCPIEALEKKMKEQNILSDEQLRDMDRQIDQELRDAVIFADSSALEISSDLEKDVFAPMKDQAYETHL